MANANAGAKARAAKKVVVASKKVAFNPPEGVLAVTLAHTKDTKGTYVFTSDVEDTVIPSLYIKKSAFPKGAPASIVIIIQEGS